MAGAQVADPAGIEQVLRCAEVPNIYVKLSGFHYASRVAWDYPHPDTRDLVRRLHAEFGPQRLCWGSDYPVVRFFLTCQHALEGFRKHCDFIPERDHAAILGGNLERLLKRS